MCASEIWPKVLKIASWQKQLDLMLPKVVSSLPRLVLKSGCCSWLQGHPEVECMEAFLALLESHKEAVPRGDALVLLCRELLLWLAHLGPSVQPITMKFIMAVDTVAKSIVNLWWNNSEALNISLQTIFEILVKVGDALSEWSPALVMS